jgi:DNA-binding transcriptional ArsR family regulator
VGLDGGGFMGNIPVTNFTPRPAVPPALALDALGNPTRRAILSLLGDGPRAVVAIAREFPVSRPAISKHLRVLESAGLVAQAREGRRRLYRLERGGFDSARGWLEAFWTEALPAFAQVAEASWEAKSR